MTLSVVNNTLEALYGTHHRLLSVRRIALAQQISNHYVKILRGIFDPGKNCIGREREIDTAKKVNKIFRKQPVF